MESIRVKEALRTAILLSEASSSNHRVEIHEIGEVFIKNSQAYVMTAGGHWKCLTPDNAEERLAEMIEESSEERIKARLQEMLFNSEKKSA